MGPCTGPCGLPQDEAGPAQHGCQTDPGNRQDGRSEMLPPEPAFSRLLQICSELRWGRKLDLVSEKADEQSEYEEKSAAQGDWKTSGKRLGVGTKAFGRGLTLHSLTERLRTSYLLDLSHICKRG